MCGRSLWRSGVTVRILNARCARGHTLIPKDAAVLVAGRSRSSHRTPNTVWSGCNRADVVMEHHHRQAAKRGSAQAMQSLADLFEFYGDLREAEAWLRRAAQAGDQEAVARLTGIATRLDRT